MTDSVNCATVAAVSRCQCHGGWPSVYLGLPLLLSYLYLFQRLYKTTYSAAGKDSVAHQQKRSTKDLATVDGPNAAWIATSQSLKARVAQTNPQSIVRQPLSPSNVSTLAKRVRFVDEARRK